MKAVFIFKSLALNYIYSVLLCYFMTGIMIKELFYIKGNYYFHSINIGHHYFLCMVFFVVVVVSCCCSNGDTCNISIELFLYLLFIYLFFHHDIHHQRLSHFRVTVEAKVDPSSSASHHSVYIS